MGKVRVLQEKSSISKKLVFGLQILSLASERVYQVPVLGLAETVTLSQLFAEALNCTSVRSRLCWRKARYSAFLLACHPVPHEEETQFPPRGRF